MKKFGGQTECIMGNWKIVNNPEQKHDFILKQTREGSSISG